MKYSFRCLVLIIRFWCFTEFPKSLAIRIFWICLAALSSMYSFINIIPSEQKAVIFNLAKELEKKYEIRTNSNNNNVLQTFMDYDDRKVFIW